MVGLKSDVDKIDIDRVKNVPTCLNNLKTDVDKLILTKLWTIPINLKTHSDVVEKSAYI